MARSIVPLGVPLLLEDRVMRAVVIYESLTGKTERASFLIADELIRLGIPTVAYDVDGPIDLDTLAAADVVVVGTWVSGHFVVRQKPGGAGKLARMPSIRGKKTAVFVTFALNPGKALQKLIALVEANGGEVIGGMEIRRDDLEGGAVEFARRLVDALESGDAFATVPDEKPAETTAS
jgi:hypothetical protein